MLGVGGAWQYLETDLVVTTRDWVTVTGIWRTKARDADKPPHNMQESPPRLTSPQCQ